jgi:hypothetical protein
VTSASSDIAKLALQKTELDNQDKGILAALAALNHAENQLKELARAEPFLAERTRKEQLIERLRKNPPICVRCLNNEEMKFKTGVTQPKMPSAGYWTVHGSNWRVVFTCHRCGLMQDVMPDLPRTCEDGSEDPEFPMSEKETRAQLPKKENTAKTASHARIHGPSWLIQE